MREYNFIKVPCGTCANCLRNKQVAWCNRLQLHAKYYRFSNFVTLTYDDYNIPLYSFETQEMFTLRQKFGNSTNLELMEYDTDAVPVLDKLDIQRFIRSIKDLCVRTLKTRFSYFAVGEYGMQNYRPHYHILFFHDSPELYNNIIPTVQKKWDKGLIHVGSVTDASIAYVTKYMLKEDSHPLSVKPDYINDVSDLQYKLFQNFQLGSNGLGADFVKEFGDYYKNFKREDLKLTNNKGYQTAMPRYLKDKVKPSNEWNYVESMKTINRIEKNERKAFESWCHQHTSKAITNDNRESLLTEWSKAKNELGQIPHKRPGK